MYENCLDIKENFKKLSSSEIEILKYIFTPVEFESSSLNKSGHIKINNFEAGHPKQSESSGSRISIINISKNIINKIRLPLNKEFEGFFAIYIKDEWLEINTSAFNKSVEIYSIDVIHSDRSPLIIWISKGCGIIDVQVGVNELYLNDGLNSTEIFMHGEEVSYFYSAIFQNEAQKRVAPLFKLSSSWKYFKPVNFYSNDYVEIAKNNEYQRSKIVIGLTGGSKFNNYEVFSRRGYVKKIAFTDEEADRVIIRFTDNFIKLDYNDDFEDIIVLKIFGVEYGFKIKLNKIGLVCEQKKLIDQKKYELAPVKYDGEEIYIFFDYAYPDYKYPQNFFVQFSFPIQPATKKISLELSSFENSSGVEFEWRDPDNLCVKLKTVNAPKISELNNLNMLKKKSEVELKEIHTGQKRFLKFEYAIRYSPAKISEINISAVEINYPVTFKIWKYFSKFEAGNNIVFLDELAAVLITVKNIVDFPILMRNFSFFTGIKNNTIIDSDLLSKTMIEGQYKKVLPPDNGLKDSHSVELRPKLSCEWRFAFIYNYYKFFEVPDLCVHSDLTVKIYDGYRPVEVKKPCYFINLSQINFIVKIYGLVLLVVLLAIIFAIARLWVIKV
ncbi:MAG TPA: hypothetical protein PKW98_08940 [Candidatus Wallbacteria bacterium]|nr:hypothetical protein [Candidatus Wallbacteria bacterium]